MATSSIKIDLSTGWPDGLNPADGKPLSATATSAPTTSSLARESASHRETHAATRAAPSHSFVGGEEGEFSAKSIMIGRPKSTLVDQVLPFAIGLGFVALVSFIFTDGLEVGTWRRVVDMLGGAENARIDTFISPPLNEADAKPKSPQPELMANPYYFLPIRGDGDTWTIRAGRPSDLRNALRRYEDSRGIGRYQLLRQLRRNPTRSLSPLFVRALSERKLWLIMEGVRGLISCGDPLPVYDLERRLATVSPALFTRYLKRLNPATVPEDRVLIRSLIKADLPWLRSLLLTRLASQRPGAMSPLDRLYLAATRYDKKAEVRRLGKFRVKDVKADEAYKKVWARELAAATGDT